MNILFTCVGRRKYLIDYFSSERNFVSKIVGVDMSHMAPGLVSCDSWYLVPSIYNDSYIDKLSEICEKERIDVLISLNDMELPVLAKSRKVFCALGVRLVLANDKAIDMCSDKYKTYLFCKENKIPSPLSYINLDDALSSLVQNRVKFPLIVKPRWGSASFGLYVVNNENELFQSYRLCKESLANSYLSEFKESDKDVIIQEFIQGKEYGVDIFNDMDGRYRGVVCKEKLSMRAGETDRAVTVSPLRFDIFSRIVGETLKHVGNMDCDFLERDGHLYLLELNPRFGGGYPFSHESGGNLVRALLLSLFGRGDEINITYEVNRCFAKCDTVVASCSPDNDRCF